MREIQRAGWGAKHDSYAGYAVMIQHWRLPCDLNDLAGLCVSAQPRAVIVFASMQECQNILSSHSIEIWGMYLIGDHVRIMHEHML